MYSFKISSRKGKKYDVYKNNKYLVSFGSKFHAHYYDRLGFYKHLNHLDNKRRDNYYKRFGRDAKPDTAKYFSHMYLW